MRMCLVIKFQSGLNKRFLQNFHFLKINFQVCTILKIHKTFKKKKKRERERPSYHFLKQQTLNNNFYKCNVVGVIVLRALPSFTAPFFPAPWPRPRSTCQLSPRPSVTHHRLSQQRDRGCPGSCKVWTDIKNLQHNIVTPSFSRFTGTILAEWLGHRVYKTFWLYWSKILQQYRNDAR